MGWRRRVVVAAGVSVVAAGVAVVVPAVRGPAGGEPVALSGGAPGAGEPGEPVVSREPWRGFEPRSISLPSGRVVLIRPVSFRVDGTAVLPLGPDELGWWARGALAGAESGRTVVAAGPGDVAAELRALPVDADVVLRGDDRPDGSGAYLRYRVVAREPAGAERLVRGGDHRLALVTEGGPLVVAVPVPLTRIALGPIGGRLPPPVPASPGR